MVSLEVAHKKNGNISTLRGRGSKRRKNGKEKPKKFTLNLPKHRTERKNLVKK